MRAPLARLAALALMAMLAACGRVVPPPATPAPPVRPMPPVVQPRPPAYPYLGFQIARGPAIASLPISQASAQRALAAFGVSCRRLVARTDQSGLTRPQDWKPACDAAASAVDPQAFFATHFEAVQVADGYSFATGYYEPEITGVRTRQAGFDVPVYALPPDLIRADPAEAEPNAAGRQPLGRRDMTGKFVPYYTRAEIENGALAGKGLEIGWAADPVEFFFMQVQGSGRLRAPDGTVMRLGYAGQNGWPYTSIGAVLREAGILGDGPGQVPASMQGIMGWLRANPDQARTLMQRDEAYVFFRELTGPGPIGALNVPVTARATVAADPNFVPLGAPVWLVMDDPVASGLWVAQDTGGAIKGTNRFDTFWGAGDEARRIAGGMTARGKALLFLPKGTLARFGKQ